MDETHGGAVTVEELEELRAESRRRQSELKELAAALPATRSRRRIVVQMLSDLAHVPHKPTVVRRVAVKIVRTPVDLLRRTGR